MTAHAALTIAIQMDPIADIDITGDTSFALALEAQARGHAIYYYTPDALSCWTAKSAPACTLLKWPIRRARILRWGRQLTDLAAMDVVLMRQDPPFDMNYISATHFLERIHPDTLVVNDPAAVRNAPEKIFPILFEGCCRRP